MAKATTEQRFWSKVSKTETCWLWTGDRNLLGYGRFRAKGHYFAHRFAYALLIGPIPTGFVIDHLCRVPACVNPEHLEPVTIRENTRRSKNFVADQMQQTHCLRGHLFDEANTILKRRKSGYISRNCRTCHRIRRRK